MQRLGVGVQLDFSREHFIFENAIPDELPSFKGGHSIRRTDIEVAEYIGVGVEVFREMLVRCDHDELDVRFEDQYE